MKIRVMGTKAECEQAQEFYRQFAESDGVLACSISGLYANRGSTGFYRVYIEIECESKANIYGSVIKRSNRPLLSLPDGRPLIGVIGGKQ